MGETRTHILFVITKGTWGGAQRYVYDMTTHLPPKTYAVSVALGTPGILKEKLDASGIRTIPLSHLGRDVSLRSDVRAWWELLSLFHAERPNIVHLNSSKAAGLGALAARVAAVPKIICTIHGLPYEEERPLPQKIAIAFFTYLTCLLSTDVIVLSERARRSLARFPFLAKKIHVVPLGIEPPRFAARAAARAALAERTDVPLAQDDFLIISIGELHKNKGYDLALGALTALARTNRNFRYIIIGEGEERATLEAKIAASGLTGNVFLAGFIPNAASLLPAADLFLIPSRKEGTPYVLLEALAAHVPIIASTAGDISEVLSDMPAYLFSIHNNPAFTHALHTYLTRTTQETDNAPKMEVGLPRGYTLATMKQALCNVYQKTKKDSLS